MASFQEFEDMTCPQRPYYIVLSTFHSTIYELGHSQMCFINCILLDICNRWEALYEYASSIKDHILLYGTRMVCKYCLHIHMPLHHRPRSIKAGSMWGPKPSTTHSQTQCAFVCYEYSTINLLDPLNDVHIYKGKIGI